jgi:hypothetical protein
MRAFTQGGTNAGWRTPFAGAALPWQCDCDHTVEFGNGQTGRVRKTNPGFLANCLRCGGRRDGR